MLISFYKNYSQNEWQKLNEINLEQISLGDISFSDNKIGIISSFSQKGLGVLHKTNDAGNKWELIFENQNIKTHLSSIGILGNNFIWFIHSQNIYLTKDGGTNWKTINFNFLLGNLKSIIFNSFEEGLIFAEKGIYKTTDGGENWNHQFYSQNYLDNAFLSSINPLNGNGYAIFGENFPLVYKTTDYGINWEYDFQIPKQGQSTNIREINYNGIIIGNYDYGSIGKDGFIFRKKGTWKKVTNFFHEISRFFEIEEDLFIYRNNKVYNLSTNEEIADINNEYIIHFDKLNNELIFALSNKTLYAYASSANLSLEKFNKLERQFYDILKNTDGTTSIIFKNLQVGKAELYNILGKAIKKIDLRNTKKLIISEKGIFIISLKYENRIYNLKIIN